MSGVLEGLKILEMGHVVAAPTAGVTFADWGAEVIKIEPPSGDMARHFIHPFPDEDKDSAGRPKFKHGYFHNLNRGKKAVALNLRSESAKEIAGKLVAWADIFFTNYTVSALNKLGMDYETLKKHNPRLIYGVLTGFGTAGPDKDSRGFDMSAAWARSGIMHMMGEPGSNPPPQRGGIMDRVAGSHMVGALLAALYHRDRTGEGQKVEFSLYHTGVWANSEDILPTLQGGNPQKFDRTKSGNPLWNSYKTKDDRWFWSAMLQADRYWGSFCRALGHPEWEHDPKFDTAENRFGNREELIRLIDQALATKTYAEWEPIFREHDFIYGKVQTPQEVINDPQAHANDFFVSLKLPDRPDVTTLMSPVKFVENPAEVRSCGPELSQHTEEILLSLNYSQEDIARFKEEEAIL